MLIGGFQHFDTESALRDNEGRVFPLPFDASGDYTRQVFTNNGRTATVYLLESCMEIGPEDYVLLPDYLCLSIITALEAGKCGFRFYRVNRDLSIDLEDLKAKLEEDRAAEAASEASAPGGDAAASAVGRCKAIYLTHFFGTAYPDDVTDRLIELSKEYGLPIIEDLTQSLLTRPYAGHKGIGFGDYIVASTRKWFPNSDGGLVAGRGGSGCDPDGGAGGAFFPIVPLGDPYNEAAYKQLLISLIRDRFDEIAAADPAADLSSYIPYEREANRVRYTDLEVREMTPYSRNVMMNADLGDCARRRRDNYQFLWNELAGTPGLSILSEPLDGADGIVPFGLVIMVEDRNKLYDFLAARGIVGEIQWLLPLDYYEPGDDARYLSDHNLMLQCYQGYDETKLKIMADAVKEFLKA